MYEAENTFRLKGFQIFCCQTKKDKLVTVGLLRNATAVQNIQTLCYHSSPLFINLLCFRFSDCNCHLCSYFSCFFHAGLPLFIPNLTLLPKGLICSPAAQPNTLSITYASVSASLTPTSVIHFSFGHPSFQLSHSSQLAAIAVRTPEPSPTDYAIILLCQCSYLLFGRRGIQFHIGH